MILSLTAGRPALRNALVDQGLISRAEADNGIRVATQGRKRLGRRLPPMPTSPNPRPTPAPATAVGVAQVVTR
jgi:hypothetical protein